MGAIVQTMSCEDYDDFINMGFRRSGGFLYKTDMLRNCCRYYTIRTDLSQCKLDKKLRQATNRFIRAISDTTGEEHKDKKAHNNKFDIQELIEAEVKSSRFYTRFEKSEFSQEKFNLYKKYQIQVHNDPPEGVSKEQFVRFLCDNPFDDIEENGPNQQWDQLNNWTVNKKSSVRRLGATHECYYLDGKLIAFSVMDFLPSGISSVYFVWDPDYAHLSLGSISGLRELLLIDTLDLGYYYLGYYIEDCTKMIYKGKFGGELLDLCNETYFPLSEVKPYIQESKLFVMGTESEHYEKEIEIKNDFPDSKAEKEALISKPLNTNIVDRLYNQALFENTQLTHNSIKAYVDLTESDFPSIVPGLIPLHQIETYLKEGLIQDLELIFYYAYSGELKRKTFSTMTKREKIVAIDSIRLFGMNKIAKLFIVY